jgi:glyoxylase I family protein
VELHHLALGARDVAAVSSFYRDQLGLPEVRRHHRQDGTLRSIWLALGASVLMIERCEETTPPSFMRPGLFLIAFRVAKSDRLALERRLEASGHPIESRTTHTSYARDPEGNRVAISEHPLFEEA